MKIVNIIGGLGNQMFQYAFALSLKERFPGEDVLIDTTHFNHIFVRKFRGANLHNGYEIEKVFPNAKLKHASCWQLMRVTWYMPNYLLSRVVRRGLPKRKTEYIQPLSASFTHLPEVYNIKGDCYYEGIWESVKNYIPCRDVIQQTFAHSEPDDEINRSYINQMEASDSVGIHIRRGDYLYEPAFMNICDVDYYEHAIGEILSDKRQHEFYIFSNDMPWCQKHIAPLLKGYKLVFVNNNEGKDACWDMFLMTHCKDLVIANSSFSWWGAFLNKRNGRVVAPKKWVNREAEYDIWLDNWIRL